MQPTLSSSNEKVIALCDQCIEYCNANSLSYGLSRLYFRKGIAEYNLDHENFLSSLKLSIALLQATNQSKQVDVYTDILLKQYKILL